MSDRPAGVKGVVLAQLQRTIDEAGLHYGYVDVQWNRAARTVTITVRAPETTPEDSLDKVVAAGVDLWAPPKGRDVGRALLTLCAGAVESVLWVINKTGN